ncbi:MAG: ParA family protein [Bacteroidaceae bacterium]|nr:ParA family protein [Bacteroidaceae bacterium]
MKGKNEKTRLHGIIAIGNYKGGVGKTTTTLNLATALRLQGYRVLIMDFDHQCNLTSCTDWEQERELAGDPTIFDTLTRGADIPVYRDSSGLYYTPSTIGMSEASAKLSTVRNAANVLARAFRRSIDDHTGEGLVEWGSSFDYILMDSPVAPVVVTDNILIAATALVIPVSLEGFTLDGLDNYLGYVADIQGNDNERLDVLGAIVTMRQGNLTEAKQSEAALRDKFGKQIFQTVISRRSAVSKSLFHHVSIFDFDHNNPVAEEFIMLANEVQRKLKKVTL